MSRDEVPALVLVPGAWLGGWAWRDVARELRAAGHDVHPLTLTGLGDRAHLAHPEVDLETHIADVVAVLDAEDLRDVVLVGHSYAGVVITAVADRRPDRLGAVVWLDSAPVPDGIAIVDALSSDQRTRYERDVRERGDGWRLPVLDHETLGSGMFGSAAGLDDTHLDMIEQRGSPQPYATFTSPLRRTDSGLPSYRRAVVICTAGGMTADMLREAIGQGDPRAAALAGPDWEFYELATGHWPMFSAPVDLARLLHTTATSSPSKP
jgi:pimeloyl-ACP methyl ester carboxylesterase